MLASLDRRACRTHVEREFSIERMVDRYLDAYAQALDLRTPPPPSVEKLRVRQPRLVGSPDGVHGDSAQTKGARLFMKLRTERDYSGRSLFEKLGVFAKHTLRSSAVTNESFVPL